MHAIVWRVTINDRDEADRLLRDEFVPAVPRAPGFVGAYWVETGDNHGTSVIVFESEEAARAVADQPTPETDALTVESFELGEVVAHA